MKTWVLGISAALAFGVGESSAATLGLETGDAWLLSDAVTVEVFDDGVEGGITAQSSTGTVSSDFMAQGLPVFFLDYIYSYEQPDVINGGLADLSDNVDFLFAADVVDVGFTSNTLEFLLDPANGFVAIPFDGLLLATLEFDLQLGQEPFSLLSEQGRVQTSVEVAPVTGVIVAAVPLSASSMFLGFGLAALITARRRVSGSLLN